MFAQWTWDGTTLSAEVDRYGFFSLFYAVDGDTVRLSPSLLALAARGAALKPDRRALGVFHRLGMFINDDTPFKGIKVLPPGGTLTWRDGKLRVDAPKRSFREQQISRADAVDGMIELFRQAMARVLDTWAGPIILPLSGGRDSRHILLELMRQGRAPDACVTFHHGGANWNTEVKAARAICEAAGVRHEVLGHPRSRSVDILRTIVLTQLCADEHAQMMPLYDYLLDHQEAAAFDGIAGDILTNPDDDAALFFQLARSGDFPAIARHMIAGHGGIISRGAEGAGAGSAFSPGRDEETVAYVAKAIEAYADAPDPYQMFWLLHRTRREISFVAQGMFSPAKAVFTPYLDQDFVEFCTSLPFSVTRGQKLHDDAMAKAYPSYRHVPFEEGFRADAPTPSSPRHKLAGLIDAARVARFLSPSNPVPEVRALLGRGSSLRTGPAAVYHLHDRLVNTLTARRAQELLDFAKRLEMARPRALVAECFTPRVGHVDSV